MNSGSIHDPIRGRIDRLAEIQSKSDRLLVRDRLLLEEDAAAYVKKAQDAPVGK